jgi:proline iminopeptidase
MRKLLWSLFCLNAGGACFTSLLWLLFLPLYTWGQTQGKVQSEGVCIAYQTFGKGTPLLIINGGPGFSSAGFVPLAKTLGERYQTIVYDQRGTGNSTLAVVDSSTVNMELMTRDIEALRTHLGIGRWAILGHSFGGMMANYYISRHPERVIALIASSSGGVDLSLLENAGTGVSARLTQQQQDSVNYWRGQIQQGDTSYFARLGLARNMAPAYVYNQAYIPQVAERLTQGNMHLNRLIWADLRRLPFDCKPALQHFEAPVLIIQGTDDILDPAIAQIAHRTYPNSSLVLLERCRHYGWLDRPEAYFEAIYRFLQ